MLTYLRYALAVVCFAASVGCLALWWRSNVFIEQIDWKSDFDGEFVSAVCSFGECEVYYFGPGEHDVRVRWRVYSTRIGLDRVVLHEHYSRGLFGATSESIYFPIWYAALIFALAGVAALRFRRQFSIARRSFA